MNNEEINITCGLSFNILEDPVTLPCGHSFSLKSLQNRLDSSAADNGFACPICGAHHPGINLRTIHDFVDTKLQATITRLTEGEGERPMCQWCEEVPATMYCPDCPYLLCSECNIAVHKNAAKKHHTPVPLQDARAARQTTKKCTIRGHEEYRLEFYSIDSEQLCCAYCLQVGPCRGHNFVMVSQAAQDVRLQMGRDLENMGQIRARIEGMASELNRVQGQYQDSYDHVESAISERFRAFRQQLDQKELEVRKTISSLRDVGDRSLGESRLQYVRKLNAINGAALAYRRLQNGGADYEVLQNRATMSEFMRIDVPSVSGAGFRLSDLGDLNLAGLNITLDLNTIPGEGAPQGQSVPRSNLSSSVAPQAPTRSLFSFAADPEVDISRREDGILLKCSERASTSQVGIRAAETFESLRPQWREVNGQLSWKIRLDLLNETFLGVVEYNPGSHSEGFYWRPMRQGQFDGKVGKASQALRSLPVCHTGDVVKFTYDTANQNVRLAINNIDRGVILADVSTEVAPCFIFAPGEALTLLN